MIAPATRNGPERLAVADGDQRGQQEGRREPLQDAADEVEGGADVDAGLEPHSTRSTSEARRDSTNTITRSPARRTSLPRGKIGEPSRMIAPITEPVFGQLVEARVGELGLRAHGQVEDLEAVVVEHRDLADARVVAEAHELLGDHLARVDRDVDAAALVDLAARSGRAPARSSAGRPGTSPGPR